MRGVIMCGIIGFAKKDCLLDVYKGLELLEYRGYDSVGIAYNDFDSTYIVKQKGRVKDIKDKIRNFHSDVAIGHTRWATHGKPSETNAHPHKCGLFTVVHNGIIENADEIRKESIRKGYLFLSETDTETIAVLLQDCFDPDDVISGIKKAIDKLVGTYALAILCEYTPDTAYLVKKENPLIIGKGENFYCFASDTPALVGYTQNLYRMNDNEYAVLTQNSITLYDENLNEKHIFFTKTNITVDNVNKGNYSTFMLKEIYETPFSVKQTAEYLETLSLPLKKKYDDIYIIGCGTAYHAGLYAKGLIENLLKINAFCIPSDEFIISDCVPSDKSLVIAISQSGETADTICGIKKAKNHNAEVLAVTNVASSTVATMSDYTVTTKAGVEIAVGATKSYATQLIALRFVVYRLANLPFSIESDLCENLEKVLEYDDYVGSFVNFYDFDNLFFMGLGSDYPTALEGSLKAKEISYVFSDACPAGEIKHGPLAMVTDSTLVICIITKEKYVKNCLNAINEVKSRGAKVLAITCFEKITVDEILIPKIEENDRSIAAVIPLQLLSYHFAIKRRLDPDKPRNLAKSVTVG